MLVAQSSSNGNNHTTTTTTTTASTVDSHPSHSSPIKMERRDSTTSDSSLEQLDLGRTPKKLKLNNATNNNTNTSTPHVSSTTSSATAPAAKRFNGLPDVLKEECALEEQETPMAFDDKAIRCRIDEANDYGDDESADEKLRHNQRAAQQRHHHHHKRRSSGRLDKRASVQLEYNADNPNSLRKKFRFNRSSSDTNHSNNNESGFVDASGSSSQLLLNASSASAINSTSAIQPPAASPPLLHSSSSASASASSSPHGGNADTNGATGSGSTSHISSSVSSPESGIGERGERDMKYVCPICVVVSATPHEFTNHIRCHNYASGTTENFTCRICRKVLSSASSLDRHVLVHTGERPFNCKYCHLTFTTNGNMHRHMRTHKQHQHNHRRNSNGTKNNNSSHNSQNNSNATSTQTPVAATVGSSTPATSAQLTNGGGSGGDNDGSADVEGVQAASATATTATTVALAGANDKRLNGAVDGGCGSGSGGGESYESDGGCSTDSSSAISQSSNNQHNNNNNNNEHTNNNNNNNDSKKSGNNNNGNGKRKSSDQFDALEEIASIKRRMKTAINNNNNNNIVAASTAKDGMTVAGALVCPVCEATDFESALALGAHLDTQHPDIPAKCRECDVVFASHRQLNVHPCRQTLNAAVAAMMAKYQSVARQRADSMQEIESESEATQRRRSLSESSTGAAIDDAEEVEVQAERQRQHEHFLEQFYLSRSTMRVEQSPPPSPINEQAENDGEDDEEDYKYDIDSDCQQLQQDHKDFADIQSILNMTSSSSTSNFLKNFEQSVNTPSSNYSMDKDEEEAQDAFTSEFRKMKLRGEFPCKLCTAVFPNLRALKGHNRVHLSAMGPAGPFRCNMCPYSICDKAALVRHMRSHNGDRPYECAVCNYAFTTKANCERHLRNRHAKTSREDVKRNIIYHPSEDSSCDDPTKKLQIFSSADYDDDMELYQQQQAPPRDRSTPVSHLKEMLSAENSATSPTAKPMKIQVKRLDQLIDKSYNEPASVGDSSVAAQTPDSAPIDLSMDVLDLSKKPQSKPLPTGAAVPQRVVTPPRHSLPMPEPIHASSAVVEPTIGDDPKYDPAAWAANMPNFAPLQLQLQLMFPSLLLQNSFLPPNLEELQKLAPFMRNMFSGAAPFGMSPNKPLGSDIMGSAANLMPQVSPHLAEKDKNSLSNAVMTQMLPKNSPGASLTSRQAHAQSHMPTVLPGGPVKMVIKNGILMPKQKQRRYRTERPFACEHCSARFTLRSNMERHIKQQHPQFYAQRQRSGHHIMRGRGASSSAAMNSITHLQAAFGAPSSSSGMGQQTISDQVKYAILAQQLKARKDTDLLQQALAHGSSSVAPNHMMHDTPAGMSLPPPTLPPNGQNFNFNAMHRSSTTTPALLEDDDPKLVIDEDDEEEDDYEDDVEEIPDDEQEDEIIEAEQAKQEEPQPPAAASVNADKIFSPPAVAETRKSKSAVESIANEGAKKVAETILEQAIKAGNKPSGTTKLETPTTANSLKAMIAQAESVGKSLKEVASSQFKDESQDLVPVSKLVDNATSNAVSFTTYFRPSDVANHMEQSDEEGLVASGSASESNNSGTEDIATAAEPKKKSAYSLAPNRVSCPYCQRMFPWSSSLRRHILTHTGQKPFKCSHCPLLFTTKSNCDRHLLRKHGNIESAVSVYVPTEDVSEPIPVPKSVEEIEQQQRKKREDDERKRKAEREQVREEQLERERREKEQRQKQQQQLEQQQKQQQQQLEQEQQYLKQMSAQLGTDSSPKASSEAPNSSAASSSADLPYKCHLCESSFAERLHCLEHIKQQHTQEFTLLLAKGAIDTDADANMHAPMLPLAGDDEESSRRGGGDDASRGASGGKYPDYSNRKVICAFCLRRFWSTEDLRRHMRTHSGERPFQCEICKRKFTLKHSMLRHMKKHSGRHNGLAGDAVGDDAGSDYSDDEQPPPLPPPHPPAQLPPSVAADACYAASMMMKLREMLNNSSDWQHNLMLQKENISEEQHNSHNNDLIGNLLGISDQGILNKLLSSADEAAKFLGVDK